uniref:Uncharacterized protein MANES_S053700 n=1 Tax=Rhizophora mucronata TaxID=61149 RepID=A0A2P2JTT8_RHIMU
MLYMFLSTFNWEKSFKFVVAQIQSPQRCDFT